MGVKNELYLSHNMIHMKTISETSIQNNYSQYTLNQKKAVQSGKLRLKDDRIKVLRRIRELIKENETALLEAIYNDFGKPETEAYSSEILFTYNDIDHHIKHLGSWMRPRRVGTSLFNQPGSSHIYSEPYGSVLIIAPWNYPFQLLIAPAVAAISAGNAVILKPSEMTPHTESLIARMFNQAFDEDIIKVVTGGKEATEALIDARPDYIFFTGSTQVGSLIMQRAAKYLIPVTLELGGKSPCIVHEDASMKVAVRRIAWGKCMNAGQTCIAPDYILLHETKIEEFVNLYKETIEERYGQDILHNADYAQIVNQHHYDRLISLLEGDIIYGGQVDKESRRISPTLVLNPTTDMSMMQEEIFGPILPIITYTNINEAIEFVQSGNKPLALYLFSKSEKIKDIVLSETSSGGVCINDTIMHIVSNELPFGGVGPSGMGSYHGKYGFDTFSHKKSVLRKATWIDPSVRYPPYKLNWRKLERIFLWMAG